MLERGLRLAILLGGVAVLLVPAARGHNAWLGWMPLWLLGMPLSAWWALHRFALPTRVRERTVPAKKRRRLRAQAKRWHPQITGHIARAA
jgi:hypothetical protein